MHESSPNLSPVSVSEAHRAVTLANLITFKIGIITRRSDQPLCLEGMHHNSDFAGVHSSVATNAVKVGIRALPTNMCAYPVAHTRRHLMRIENRNSNTWLCTGPSCQFSLRSLAFIQDVMNLGGSAIVIGMFRLFGRVPIWRLYAKSSPCVKGPSAEIRSKSSAVRSRPILKSARPIQHIRNYRIDWLGFSCLWRLNSAR